LVGVIKEKIEPDVILTHIQGCELLFYALFRA